MILSFAAVYCIEMPPSCQERGEPERLNEAARGGIILARGLFKSKKIVYNKSDRNAKEDER